MTGAAAARGALRGSAATFAVVALATIGAAACGGSAVDARYPRHEAGCAVKRFPAEPSFAVDDLGVVSVDCGRATSCERELMDQVCARGGDVAWGLGDNALTATHLVAHAAHSKRASAGPRPRGCDVRTFDEAPSIPTENIGPVSATCAADDSKDTCLRELQDQVCLLGGDVLWQVEGPRAAGDKQRLSGRAAHTR